MNIILSIRRFLHALRHASLPRAAALACNFAMAAPGAHGPGGEHLDEAGRPAAGTALPRIVAKSELFELVAELKGGELVIVVDRFETNEPVLNARLEVASGGLESVAAFRAEAGDYVVADPALLKALATPGEHALLFTLAAGKDTDLLDGTLVMPGAKTGAGEGGHAHDGEGAHDHERERGVWIGAGVLALGLLAGFVWWRRRHRQRRMLSEGAAS